MVVPDQTTQVDAFFTSVCVALGNGKMEYFDMPLRHDKTAQWFLIQAGVLGPHFNLF